MDLLFTLLAVGLAYFVYKYVVLPLLYLRQMKS